MLFNDEFLSVPNIEPATGMADGASLQVIDWRGSILLTHDIDACNGCLDAADGLVGMQVFCSQDFRGGLQQPATLLVQTRIDTHKIDEIELDGFSLLIHCPADVNATALDIRCLMIALHIGLVVSIAPSEEEQHPEILAVTPGHSTRHVIAILG